MAENENSNPLKDLLNSNEETVYALEDTQTKVLSYLKLMVQRYAKSDTEALKRVVINTAKIAGDKSSEQAILKKLTDSMDTEEDQSTALKKIHSQIIQSNKNLTEIDKSVDETRSSAISNLSGRVDRFNGWISQTVDSVTNFDGSISEATKTISMKVPIIGGALGAIAGFVTKNVDVWQELSSVGVTFNGNLTQLSQQILESGLGYQRATKFLSQFSNVASATGSKYMLELQKQTRLLSAEFGRYGMTLDQVTEFTGSYLESQMALGTYQKLDAKQQAFATNEYIKQLHQLTQLTGKQIEEIDRARRANILSADTQSAIANILANEGPEAADNFRKSLETTSTFFAAMPGEVGPAMNDVINHFGKFGTIATSEFGRVAEIMGGDLSKNMTKLGDAMKSGDMDKVNSLMADMAVELTNLSDAQLKQLGSLERSGGESAQIAGEYLKMHAALQSSTLRDIKDGAEMQRVVAERMKQEKEQGGQTSNLISLGEKLNDIWTKFASAIGPRILDVVGTLADKLTTLINDPVFQGRMVEVFNQVTSWLSGLPEEVGPTLQLIKDTWNQWIPTITELFGKLAKGGQWLLDNWQVVAASFAALVSGKIIFSIISSFNMLRKGLSIFGNSLSGANGLLSKFGGATGGKAANMLSKGGNILSTGGKWLSRGLGLAGVALSLGENAYDVAKSAVTDEKMKGEDVGGLVGGVAGGLVGLLGGPVGAAIGASIGTAAGEWIGGFFDEEEKIAKPVPRKYSDTVEIKDLQLNNTPQNDSVSAIGKTNDGIKDLVSETTSTNVKLDQLINSSPSNLNNDLLNKIKSLLESQNNILMQQASINEQIAKSVKRSEPDNFSRPNTV